MTLTSGGDLLVGKSVTTFANNGVVLKSSGEVDVTRNDSIPFYIRRNTSDGDLLQLYKDSTTVGSIGTKSGNLFIGSTNGSDSHLTFGSNIVFPANSNGDAKSDAIDLGAAWGRFKDLYLSGGAYLGGTGAANKLSDYEEGTWTPSGATGFPGGGAPQSITATYTKVGDTVSVRAVFNAYNDGTNLNISGLPFSASANSAASISISTGKSFVNERVSGSSFYCTISGTDTSLRTFYLEATYRTAS